MKSLALIIPALVCGSALADGFGAAEVRLDGPLARRFADLERNHVAAQDTTYLTDHFRHKTERENWWQTEFWGKYMHSAVPFSAYFGDGALRAKVDASVKAMLSAQDADGYLGNYPDDIRGNDGWDVWGVKYTLLGLLHYVEMTGDDASRRAACRLCDWLIARVGPTSSRTISKTGNYAGQPSCSVLEPVVWLYRLTKEQKYLDFATFIVREMTEAENGPRLLDLAQKGVPVADRSPLPPNEDVSIWNTLKTNRGKAYEMMSCYQGLIEYARVTGRRDLVQAAVASAESIVGDELNLAGGCASYEHFYHGAERQHLPYAHTQETCVTITWMRLCATLLEETKDSRWADEIDRTFRNAYLASLAADGSVFAAYTPLNGSRSVGHIHCRMHTNCCNMNGARGFTSFIRSFFRAEGDVVYLSQYSSSRLGATLANGKRVSFVQYTQYPAEGDVDLRCRVESPTEFTLMLRIPAWSERTTVKVNRESIKDVRPGKYLAIRRVWKPGDSVRILFDMSVKPHFVDRHVAFTSGPILLARSSRFAEGDLDEPISPIVRTWKTAPIRRVRAGRPLTDEIRYAGEIPFAGHDENPDGRVAAETKFMDYATAGDRWQATDYYRTWLPIVRSPAVLRK